MITLSLHEFLVLLGKFFWPLLRVTGFMLVAPIFSDRSITYKLRLILSFSLALLLAPLANINVPFEPFSVATILGAGNELLIGGMLGLGFSIFFGLFITAGQIISMQMGLAMAIMNDPSNGISVAIIGRILLICITLLFLSVDGHIFMVATLKDSMDAIPVGTSVYNLNITALIKMVSWMFAQGLLLSIPAISVMFACNTTFGLLTRISPSLNIFALGFPLTMLLGIMALTATVTRMGDVFFSMSDTLNEHINFLLDIR
ncbi:flagellar biosynthetic protein FliR (plasmid) [Vibrio breoganii]|uniref:Flagellar biosynthetic protein FliR n=1 Tax=Vibrio breoganii TaxID=553239 RepID=A0AAN1CUG1_9VIBR|nr:flagellar biosynthetic protein FliR [Vibrio breoganii]ANO35284.1 flagellar biosynthetic protein FliR [Vibrio breoganii]